MNWDMIASALIVSVALVFSAKEFARELAKGQGHQTRAGIAALLISARLTDRRYAEQIEKLRAIVDYGIPEYPGSPERVREKEEEIEWAKGKLRQIDYMETRGRQRWIALVSDIYREVA